jgi:hypothetical protein
MTLHNGLEKSLGEQVDESDVMAINQILFWNCYGSPSGDDQPGRQSSTWGSEHE